MPAEEQWATTFAQLLDWLGTTPAEVNTQLLKTRPPAAAALQQLASERREIRPPRQLLELYEIFDGLAIGGLAVARLAGIYPVSPYRGKFGEFLVLGDLDDAGVLLIHNNTHDSTVYAGDFAANEPEVLAESIKAFLIGCLSL